MRFIWFFLITLNMIAGQCAQASTPDFNHAGVHYLRPPTIEQTDYEEGPLEQYPYQGETFSVPHLDQAQAYCAAQGAELISDEQLLALQAATPAESLPLQHNWPAGYAPYLTRTQEMHAGVLSNVVYFLDEETGSLIRELRPSDQAQGYVSCLQLFDASFEGKVPVQLLYNSPAPVHYTIINIGTAPLTEIDLQFNLPSALVMTVTNNGCAGKTLAQGQQCQWQGTLTAKQAGEFEFSASLSFAGATKARVKTHKINISEVTVREIYSNNYAFAALKADGSVVTWGDASNGGDSSSVAGALQSKVVSVYSTYHGAFAALKTDGSVVTWGNPEYGGDSSSVDNSLQSGVVALYSTKCAFAALKADGSVVTWGSPEYGGDSSNVAINLQSGVMAIYSTRGGAFAALKKGGSVFTWGRSKNGGDSTSVVSKIKSGVMAIYSTHYSFAALKEDGSVVTWGDSIYGGDSSSVSSTLQSNIIGIYTTNTAFAALKKDGRVITWGRSKNGGDSSNIANELETDVVAIYSTYGAFAALKKDGHLVTWGRFRNGGDSSIVVNDLQSNVVAVYSAKYAFTALKKDGSEIIWGHSSKGGDSSSAANALQSGVVAVYATLEAFAALTAEGLVIAWGDADRGGDSSTVVNALQSDVISLYSTGTAFAALKKDGSVITWGDASYGGDSSAITFPTHPVLPSQDTDGDGLSDADEQARCNLANNIAGVNTMACLDPGRWDTDGDGISDKAELDQGTNPLNRNSHLISADGDLLQSAPVGQDEIQDINEDGWPDGWRLPQGAFGQQFSLLKQPALRPVQPPWRLGSHQS